MPAAITSGALSPDERRLSFGNRWVYAPALEQSDHLKIKPRYQVFIDGKFRALRSGRYFDSINPATEEKLTEIAEADAQDVDLAVKAARRAHRKVWSKMHGRERGKFLYRIARLIQEKSRELALLESTGWREDDQREPGDRSAPGRGAFLLLRGLGGQTRIRVSRAFAAFVRCGRANHPVEFPTPDGGLETSPSPGRGKHLRAEAGRDDQALPLCIWRKFCSKRSCPTAWSISSRGRA